MMELSEITPCGIIAQSKCYINYTLLKVFCQLLYTSLGSIEISAVRSNYLFLAQKPSVINIFKKQFAVIRENLSIFAVIKKNVAAITPLGDFDMRPTA